MILVRDCVTVSVMVTASVTVVVLVTNSVDVTVSVVVKAFVMLLSSVEVLVDVTVDVIVSGLHPLSKVVSSTAPDPARKLLLVNFLISSFIIFLLNIYYIESTAA
jgi:hypothetical protein